MHSVGIHSAMAIKRQRKRRDDQKRARERRYSTQSSESGETVHSPNSSVRYKMRHNHRERKHPSEMLESQVMTSIGMLHIGIVFMVFGIFLCGAGIIPDKAMTWSTFSTTSAWWNEVTCTGLFAFGLGFFLLVLNCLISKKEEEDLEDYVQRQLTRSRSGHRLERDVETGVLTTRHARKATTLHMPIANPASETSLATPNLTNSNQTGPSAENACFSYSVDVLLEKIVEEDNSYHSDHRVIISPVDMENDKKHLLNSETGRINLTRI